jgi:hypothetical protein
MILYHFTTASRAKQILKQGLIPKPDRSGMLGGAKAVWLTERRGLTIPLRETLAVMFRSGAYMRRWLLDGADDGEVVRLSVRIPSDHRLFEYAPWLRKHRRTVMPDRGTLHYATSLSYGHWISFEKVPASWIFRVREVVEQGPRQGVTVNGRPLMAVAS